MDRRAKLFLTLAALALTVLAFLARERGKARNRTAYDSNLREARITFEDFTATRYQDGVAVSVAKAKSGYLLEPNMLELFGDVSIRTLRRSGKREWWEKLYCETATAYFKSSSLSQMLGTSSLDHVDLKGFVKLESRGLTLETDSAMYQYGSGLLQSNVPVSVHGPSHHFKGEGGFTFDVKKENLLVAGPVKGGGNLEVQ